MRHAMAAVLCICTTRGRSLPNRAARVVDATTIHKRSCAATRLVSVRRRPRELGLGPLE